MGAAGAVSELGTVGGGEATFKHVVTRVIAASDGILAVVLPRVWQAARLVLALAAVHLVSAERRHCHTLRRCFQIEPDKYDIQQSQKRLRLFVSQLLP